MIIRATVFERRENIEGAFECKLGELFVAPQGNKLCNLSLWERDSRRFVCREFVELGGPENDPLNLMLAAINNLCGASQTFLSKCPIPLSQSIETYVSVTGFQYQRLMDFPIHAREIFLSYCQQKELTLPFVQECNPADCAYPQDFVACVREYKPPTIVVRVEITTDTADFETVLSLQIEPVCKFAECIDYKLSVECMKPHKTCKTFKLPDFPKFTGNWWILVAFAIKEIVGSNFLLDLRMAEAPPSRIGIFFRCVFVMGVTPCGEVFFKKRDKHANLESFGCKSAADSYSGCVAGF